MRQLLLDLLPETPPSLENFVPGSNGETLAALQNWLQSGQPRYASETGEGRSESSFCLWGEPGSGKTHLLLGCGLPYHDARLDPHLTNLDQDQIHLAVDHVEALSEHGQIALFNAFNRSRSRQGLLLSATRQAPAHLAMREDLRTRLGYGLIYRLTLLSDPEKIAALQGQALERGMKFPREALDYLLRHAPRDMRSLSALVVALDHYSLEQKRPITLPLLREVLASPLET